VIIAIPGLPAPSSNSLPPALPTGARTIAHPRGHVNVSHVKPRDPQCFHHLSSYIGFAFSEVWRIWEY
jgi:hypothetical protein